MKLINYSIIGLFILSLEMLTGNSFAQPMNPYTATWTPSQFQLLREGRLGPIPGAGGPVTLYGQPAALGRNTVAASTMVSSELRTPQGDYLAEISDLVIDPATGRVSDVVLTGIRGMGAKALVVPLSTVSKNGDTIFLYNAPEEVSPFSSEAPYQRWGLHLFAKQQRPMESYTTSKLIGAPVRTSKGDDLGRIDDLVIDSTDGHIVHLVVSHTGGTEGKMACVPFSALSKSGENVFVLKTTREELKTCSL